MTGDPSSTALYLTDEEIALFKKFREYQDNFQVLLQSGVLDTKRKSIMLHIDGSGAIRKVEELQRPQSIILFFQAS